MALIAGPTASGKSALAVALAKALAEAGREAVVVNADASQVYRDLAILSARPTDEEMEGVPHRLFGHVDGAEAHNAARWSDEARAEILDAHAALAAADPPAAARLNPADTTRVARALEVVRSTGRPLADWQVATTGGIADDIALTPFILLPPRDWLRARCDTRLDAMFDGGAVEETEALLARALDPDLPVMRAIGVPQIADYLHGRIDRSEALARAQAATRQYAKRQFTWFRHQPPPHWPRHTESLNIDSSKELVIILRNMVLTG